MAVFQMLERARRYAALPAANREVLLESVVALPLMWSALLLFGLAPVHRWIRSGAALPIDTLDAIPAAREASGMVDIAARRSPLPVTCLSRSLVLEWVLCRRGISSQLRIGVQIEGREMRAHAWIECGGFPVNDVPDVSQRFVPFAAVFPASRFTPS